MATRQERLGERRKLARKVRNDMSIYLIKLQPGIRDQELAPDATANAWAHQAAYHLSELLRIEKELEED
jgi:hypothetical protein